MWRFEAIAGPAVIHERDLNLQGRKMVDGRRSLVNNAGTMKTTLANKRLAVIGAGKIGGILVRAFLKQKLVQPKRVHATVRHAEKAKILAKQLGIRASTDN